MGYLDAVVALWDTGVPSEKQGRLCGDAHLLALLKCSAAANSVAFSPSGGKILCGCDDATVLLWLDRDLPRSGEKKGSHPIEPHTTFRGASFAASNVDCVGFVDEDRAVCKAACDGQIVVFSATEQSASRPSAAPKILHKLEYPATDEYFMKFRMLPNSPIIGVGSFRGSVHLYNLSKMRKIGFIESPSRHCHSPVRQVALSSSLKFLVAVYNTNVVVVWKRQEATAK